jgi:peptide deformylase
MSILNILQYPDLRLRCKAKKVLDIKCSRIQKIIKDMLETLANTKNCGGLAATQLDIEDPPSIVVKNSFDDNDEIICLINPQIVEHKKFELIEEGCMSIFPKKFTAKVKRATEVKFKAIDQHGEQIKLKVGGYFAQFVQHECDHLAGVLFIDRLAKTERVKVKKEMQDLIQKNNLNRD